MDKIIKTLLALVTLFFAATLQSASVEKLADSDRVWDGTKIPEQHIKDPHITVLRITIKPGEQLAAHQHPVINVGYLLSGQLTVVKTTTGETKKLQAGDSLIELINQWHYGKNEGKENAVIVVVYIGDKNQPLTIKQ